MRYGGVMVSVRIMVKVKFNADSADNYNNTALQAHYKYVQNAL